MSGAKADEKAAAIVEDPHCAEYQADGVPCETAGGACAECERAVDSGEAGKAPAEEKKGRADS